MRSPLRQLAGLLSSRSAPDATTSVAAVLRLCWRASPRAFVTVLMASVVSAAVMPVSLVVLRILVEAFFRGDTKAGAICAIVLATLAVLHGLVEMLVAMKQEELAARISLTAEQQLLTLASRVPLEKFHDATWYDAMARAEEGVTWRPQLAMGTLMTFVSSIVTLGGMAAIIVSLDARLILLASLAAIPLLYERRRRARVLYRVRRDSTLSERWRDYFLEILLRPDLAKDVRGYGLAGLFAAEHRRHGEEVIERELAVQRKGFRWVIVTGAASGVFLLGAYLLVGFGPEIHSSSPADLFLALTAFTSLTNGIVSLVGVIVDMEEQAAYLTDYVHLIDEGLPAVKTRQQRLMPKTSHAGKPPLIEFRDVWYSYPGGEPTLRGLSLEIRPGEHVALMGRNGAGKSTVVKLLLGLLRPNRGTVLIDGTDLRDLDEERARALFGVLFQEYGRYESTMAEAIRLGRVDEPLDQSRMWRALDGTGLRSLALSLPAGADNLIGREFPGARDLSGGQWQRLALARVLYRDAPIWVMDEPTAALDVAAESAFLRDLRSVRDRRTVLLVTHRLESARTVDRVILLRHGQLAEEGSHAQLIQLNGEYASYHQAVRNS